MLMQISFRDRTDLYSINGWLFIRKEGGIVLGVGERTGILWIGVWNCIIFILLADLIFIFFRNNM